MANLRNRIRSYTRWPADRDQRIEAAKTDVSAAVFFSRIEMDIPADVMRRADVAFDLLMAEQVPETTWED